MAINSTHMLHMTNQHIHTTLPSIQQQEIDTHTVLSRRPSQDSKSQLGMGIDMQNRHHTLMATIPRPTAHLIAIALTLNAKEDMTEYRATSTTVEEHLQKCEKDTSAGTTKAMATNPHEALLHRHTSLMITKTAFTMNKIEKHSTMIQERAQKLGHILTAGL